MPAPSTTTSTVSSGSTFQTLTCRISHHGAPANSQIPAVFFRAWTCHKPNRHSIQRANAWKRAARRLLNGENQLESAMPSGSSENQSSSSGPRRQSGCTSPRYLISTPQRFIFDELAIRSARRYHGSGFDDSGAVRTIRQPNPGGRGESHQDSSRYGRHVALQRLSSQNCGMTGQFMAVVSKQAQPRWISSSRTAKPYCSA